MGRPKKEINYKLSEELAGIFCTQEEIAGILGISVRTLQRDEEFCSIYKKYKNKKRKKRSKIRFESRKQYYRELYQKYPDCRIRNCVASNINYSLKNGRKKKGCIRHLTYTIVELMDHLEKQFKKGMNWNNYGKVWHVDHKTPVSWFNIKEIGDYEFRQCWALGNLQPMFKKDNLKKGNRRSCNNGQLLIFV